MIGSLRRFSAIQVSLFLLNLAVQIPSELSATPADSRFEEALANGQTARVALKEANRILSSAIAGVEPNSSLIRINPVESSWTVGRDAARAFPSLIVAAYLTEPDHLRGPLTETLRAEASFTSRLLRLPDDYDLRTGQFVYPTADPLRIRSGSSAYALGLPTVANVVGPGPWSERLQNIVDDLLTLASTQTVNGPLPSEDAETNGNLLRVLPSLAGWTGDSKYLEWAHRIGDTYILGVLPNSGNLPPRSWDFSLNEPRDATFSLSSASLLQGLTHLGRLEALTGSNRLSTYRPTLRKAAESLYNTSESGGFYEEMEPDGAGGYTPSLKSEVIARPDLHTSFLRFARASGESSLEKLILESVLELPDFYDQSRVSGLTLDIPAILSLFATLSDSRNAEAWLDAAQPGGTRSADPLERLLAVTTYAWFKTAGIRVVPWSDNLTYGASVTADTLFITVQSDSTWQGEIFLDYDKIPNSLSPDSTFPILFRVNPKSLYSIRIADAGMSATWSGSLLARGLRLSLQAGESRQFSVTKAPFQLPIAAGPPETF